MSVLPTARSWFNTLLHDSRSMGILLICCTAISLLLANGPLQAPWLQAWHLASPAPSFLHLPPTALHWINDGLMALFFLLAGLEIKRELRAGALATAQRALLPALAALGGMICPALLFLAVNAGGALRHGWAIPIATDIAFSLGILSLVGKRVPPSVKILLTALAIIDDLGAILTIAIFYTDSLHWMYVWSAGGCLLVLFLMNSYHVQRFRWYVLPGLILWYCMFNSGIHATVAGVLLAFFVPLPTISALEHKLHVPVNFMIMPLFALANTAILFPHPILPAIMHPLSAAVIAGLVIGKPLGIFCCSWLGVQAKLLALPADLGWKHLLGMGIMAGIGFTMSIFLSTLAFADTHGQDIAKIGVMAASLLAGITGILYFTFLKK
ncbi:Na+:H+ antiporter, NhaA family [Chitinophaga costaii]|uniref:Na(+)/H(+) antiporter NhaA n=1 Tax=Chitinophaga costaii TaxID=1335309 RepID=A0A1C4E4B1_9BACT|nr:Na+/H+ antiporter NhaA [Chitinophaga costaii]PUZ24332.1 Na+/H+ antiporter NhaA [Chitinophaga costaii]SCC38424.1 Na+:H+ antiporter, NhaA family [Chitinophaga costaii]